MLFTSHEQRSEAAALHLPQHLSLFTAASVGAMVLLLWAFIDGAQMALDLHVMMRSLHLFLKAVPAIGLFGTMTVRSLWNACHY